MVLGTEWSVCSHKQHAAGTGTGKDKLMQMSLYTHNPGIPRLLSVAIGGA